MIFFIFFQVEASVANDDGYPTDDNFSAADITQHIREKIGQDSDSASEVGITSTNQIPYFFYKLIPK